MSKSIVISNKPQAKITKEKIENMFKTFNKEEKLNTIKMLYIASRIAISNSKNKNNPKTKRNEYLNISYMFREMIRDFSKDYKKKYGIKPNIRREL